MLKLPKTYRTGGEILKIRREKTKSGSNFDIDDEILVIDKDVTREFELVADFAHEALEASLVHLGYRYANWKGKKVFVLDHDEFSYTVNEFARGILDLLEANKRK